MSEAQHSFPIPENVTHQLDEIRETLPEGPGGTDAAALTTSLLPIAAALAGLLLVVWWNNRD